MNKSTDHLISDLQLLRQASQGDPDAFGVLYDRYSTPIYNYLLRLIHEQTAAEDVLQEIFMAAWRGAKLFRGHSSVKTWLFRIAHNQAVSWLRRHRKNGPTSSAVVKLPESTPEEAATPEEQSIANWQSDQIAQALDQLSETHRAVVELTFVHNFSYVEIARIMDCPAGTVKSRMSYALRYLNGILRQMGVEE